MIWSVLNLFVIHSFIRLFFLWFAEICETDLKRKASLCEELLKVVKVLEPGKSIFRGKLLVDLQEAQFFLIEQRIKNGEISKLVARVSILYSLESHKQTHSIFKYDEMWKSVQNNNLSLSFFFRRKNIKSSQFCWTKQIAFLNLMLPWNQCWQSELMS